jgi:peptide/nickel transport system ATP-binding protein
VATPSPVLSVENLTVRLPPHADRLNAVEDVTFTVAPGEIVCIVGESGSGKSVTAHAIMGLLPRGDLTPTAGRILLESHDLLVKSPAELRALRGDRMAMIFQEPMTALNPCLTIGEQMAEVLRHHKRASKAVARDRAVFLLEKVGIPGAAQRLGQYPHQLSGGLRQRVMIAMALMCGPDLVIADEPTTALDVTIQAQILLLLRDLQKEFHMGLLLITHDLGVVARVADRVAVMYAGEVVESGTAAQVFAEPSHPYTRGLLSCVPVPGRTRGSLLGVVPGSVPSMVGGIRGCAFRERCGIALPACAAPGPVNATLGLDRTVRCLRVS